MRKTLMTISFAFFFGNIVSISFSVKNKMHPVDNMSCAFIDNTNFETACIIGLLFTTILTAKAISNCLNDRDLFHPLCFLFSFLPGLAIGEKFIVPAITNECSNRYISNNLLLIYIVGLNP